MLTLNANQLAEIDGLRSRYDAEILEGASLQLAEQNGGTIAVALTAKRAEGDDYRPPQFLGYLAADGTLYDPRRQR